jgi:hypothetical protein
LPGKKKRWIKPHLPAEARNPSTKPAVIRREKR